MSNTPFVPERPEKTIKVEVSVKEASLIRILRKYSFGRFVVHKANKLLVRVEINDSQMIDGKNGLDLAIE